jgi:hypothetical protein
MNPTALSTLFSTLIHIGLLLAFLWQWQPIARNKHDTVIAVLLTATAPAAETPVDPHPEPVEQPQLQPKKKVLEEEAVDVPIKAVQHEIKKNPATPTPARKKRNVTQQPPRITETQPQQKAEQPAATPPEEIT